MIGMTSRRCRHMGGMCAATIAVPMRAAIASIAKARVVAVKEIS